MKLGLIARADNSGLGIQTWEFYRHMKPDRTMVVDISKFNGNEQHLERYPTGVFIYGFPSNKQIDDFLIDLDVVFIAEAAYNPYLYDRARELGIKTAVQYNYEFMDWLINPNYPKPDMLIAPSKWHYSDVDDWCRSNGVRHVYLHCPVNREALPFREIHQARTFLHNAGKSAAQDRNGTNTVIDASSYLETNAQILIHFQGQQGLPHQMTHSIEDYAERLRRYGDEDKVTIERVELENYADCYSEGDVMILPRRYGGNCLPLNEALSIGMPVIMPAISPNTDFLPKNWLIEAERIGSFMPRTLVDIYDVKPKLLAKRIDAFYNMDEAGMLTENVRASNLAERISWENMRYQYIKVFEDLCTR